MSAMNAILKMIKEINGIISGGSGDSSDSRVESHCNAIEVRFDKYKRFVVNSMQTMGLWQAFKNNCALS